MAAKPKAKKKAPARKPVVEMSDNEFDREVLSRIKPVGALLMTLRNGLEHDEEGEVHLTHATMNRLLASFCVSFNIPFDVVVRTLTAEYQNSIQDQVQIDAMLKASVKH